MKFAIYFLLLLLLSGVISTHLSVRGSRSDAERSFAIRISAFAWLLGFLFIGAFVFLPNKQRVLMLLPAFFIALGIAKFWRNSRARLRREQQERVDIDRMKRVN